MTTTKRKSHKQNTYTSWRGWLDPQALLVPDESFPLYDLNRKRLNWAATPQKTWSWLRSIFIVTISVMVLIWFLVAAQSTDYYSSLFDYLVWAFIISMTFLSVILDFSAMVVTFDSMNSEKTSQRWDLLVLATDKDTLSRSKHAFTQLRIARVLMFNIAVRVGLVVSLLLTVTVGGYFYQYGTTWVHMLDEMREYPLEALGFATFIIPAALFFLYEPLWRVRTLTAMGVALSGRVQRYALLVPLAFALVVAFWIMQSIVLSVISYLMAIIGNSVSATLFYWEDPVLEGMAASFVGGTLLWLAGMIYVVTLAGFNYAMTDTAYKKIKSRIP